MADDFRIKGPTPSELVELLEKQDLVMESFEEEIVACKEQLSMVADIENEKTNTDQNFADLIKESEDKLKASFESNDILKRENDQLKEELSLIRRKLDEDDPIKNVVQLREKLSETEFELERHKRTENMLANELQAEKSKRIQNEQEYDLNIVSKQKIISNLSMKLEAKEKEIAEMKLNLEGFVLERDHQHRSTTSEIGVLKQKLVNLEVLSEQLSKEVTVLRGEKSTLQSRISTVSQENFHLRSQVLRKDETVPVQSSDEELVKLLGDQSHLISALKEEIRLMTKAMENAEQDNKSKIKKLHSQNRDLEKRLGKLVSLNN